MAQIEEVMGLDITLINIDFSSVLESEDFVVESIDPNDNLMSLSYKYYGTINRWWCLFYFNELSYIDTSIIDSKRIDLYVKELASDISKYNLSDPNKKNKTREAVREMLMSSGLSIKEAISEAELILDGTIPSDNITDKLFVDIVSNVLLTTEIKVPSVEVVYKMIAILDDYIKTHSRNL